MNLIELISPESIRAPLVATDKQDVINSGHCDLVCDGDMFYFCGGNASQCAFGLTDAQIDAGLDIDIAILHTTDIAKKLSTEYIY